MSFTGQVLNITDDDLFNVILGQIDPALLINGSGSPVATLAAINPIWYYDTVGQNLYFAYVADGTVDGTTWIQINFNIVDAEVGQAGIAALATQEMVEAGTDNTTIVTPYAASILAMAGDNSDITELSGLTIPLSQGQGGTGAETVLAAITAALPDMVAGNFLSNDGTNFLWNTPSDDQVLIVSSNITLAANTFHLIIGTGLTLTLPTGYTGLNFRIGFLPGLSPGTIIGTSDDIIENQAGPLICDVVDCAFELEYLNSEYGWWIAAKT